MPIDSPLAIVGMACRLPGADNLDEYWELVRDGRCALGELPADRMCRELYYDPAKGKRGKSYSTIAGVVEPRSIDASSWQLSTSALKSADSSQLELCAVAEDALRHGELDPRDLGGTRTGVYVGHTRGSSRSVWTSYASLVEHTAEVLRDVDGLDALLQGQTAEVIEEVVGAVRGEFPTRGAEGEPVYGVCEGARVVSEAFGFDGPYFSVDAACASSFMAMTMGMQALQLGEIDMAIVGGASRCEYDTMVLFSKAQSVSATGSRPFDAEADGLIAAEGYVMLVVKTLEQALCDRDPIQAVIRGIGVSSDGRGKSLWAPRKEGQVQALHRAYESADEIQRLQFIEAHATSTQVGDATELDALAEALRKHLPPETKIPIGSVKANVGHTLEVAGVAGLLKVVLAMQHRTIPPVIGVSRPNPKIDWERMPFELPASSRPWPQPVGGGPRRAAVNAFGIGGLNTHVVVDEFVPQPAQSPVVKRRAEFEPIAIIGASAMFPGAGSLDEFWELLQAGRSAIGEVPPNRWRLDLAYEKGARRPWRIPSRIGGFVENFEFDWKKHRIPPKQVAKADPLQFMLLDAVDKALEDAGLNADRDRSRVGVVVGTTFAGDFRECLYAGIHLPEFCRTLTKVLVQRGLDAGRIEQICRQYEDLLMERMPALEDDTGSFTPSTLASRITKTFDLAGGAAAVDCGEASSLGALDICLQMLRTGRNETMVCAAGHRAMGLSSYQRMGMAGWLADDQAHDPYDRQTRGRVPGEGVGVVVLKRLRDAQRDGDEVHAVIRGCGAAKQEQLQNSVRTAMERCLESGKIAADRVRTVVTAASGVTPYDQIECQGLTQALGNRREPAVLSSVAGQIGACGGSAGMASLLKAVLMIQNGKLPGTPGRSGTADWLESQRCVRLLDGESGKFSNDGSYADVNSHDMSQLAYHVALQHPQPIDPPTREDSPRHSANNTESNHRIVRVGAKSREELIRQAELLLNDPSSWFLQVTEEPFADDDPARLAIVADSPEDLARKAALAIKQHDRREARTALRDRGIFLGNLPRQRPDIVFLFPGQASQYPGMLKSLVAQFAPAAEAVQRMNGVLAQLNFPSFEQIAWEDGEQLGSDPWRTQFAVLLADSVMFAALRAWGVQPDRVAGHSFGEWPALWAAGAWSFADAAIATDLRCRAVADNVAPGGLMLSTTAPLAEVADLCRTASEVFVTNHNSPRQVVVGGSRQAVARLQQQMESAGHKTTVLPVPCPFHTPLMEPARRPLKEALEQVTLRPSCLPLMSSVTNAYVADPASIRENLANQLIEPVRYVELIERMVAEGTTIFVEVGPSRVLTRLNRGILDDRSLISIPSDDRNRDGLQSLLHVRACLEVCGAFPKRRDTELEYGDAIDVPFVSANPPQRHAAAGSPPDDAFEAAFQAGHEHGRRHAREILATLRGFADRAGYQRGFPPSLGPAADCPETVFLADELSELRGMASGARVSLPSLIAHNLIAYGKRNPEGGRIPGLLASPSRQSLDLPRHDNGPSPRKRHSTIGEAEYLASVQESADHDAGVCRRFVLRLLPLALKKNQQQEPLRGAAIVHGNNPVARALCNRLETLGVTARGITSSDPADCLRALNEGWNVEAAPTLFLTSAYDAALAEPPRPGDEVLTPLLICQRWHELLKTADLFDRGRVVALTNLGGDAGLSGDIPAVSGGGLGGLMKALYVEESQMGKATGFRSLCIDADSKMSPADVAEVVCREVTHRTAEVEVGYLDGRRHVVRAVRQTLDGPRTSPAGGCCIVTGGARGVTAVVARELAQQFQWQLHLIGASPPPELSDAWRGLDVEQTKALRTSVLREARARGEAPLEAWSRIEKAIEMDANLRAFDDAGVSAQYHACDISDRSALEKVLRTIRASGPISGILHGAGFEKSCRFKSKKAELVQRTLQAKVDGAAWLMELTQDDPLRFFVGFGSTSGCLGSHGQTDYCAANEMLGKLINRFRSQRADCNSAIFHWHAWDEVGMAVRPEIAGVLKSFGLKFMPTREGITFLADEIRAGLPEPEVLITEWSHYRRLRPQSLTDVTELAAPVSDASDAVTPKIELAALPLLDEIERWEPGQQIHVRTHLDPRREPFLVQHTLKGKPVLPIVAGLEMFAEAASLLTGEPARECRNIEVLNALRFFTDRVQSVGTRLTRSGDKLQCTLVCDFLNQRGVTMKKDKPYLQAEIATGEAELPRSHPQEPEAWIPMVYQDEEHVIYHGPALRCLKQMYGSDGQAIGRATAPADLAELGGKRRGNRWSFSPALLDACFFGAGAHLWYVHGGAVGIPQSIDRLRIGRMPRANESCWLEICFHGEQQDRGRFDLVLSGDNGDAIFLIDGYHNIIIPGTRAR